MARKPEVIIDAATLTREEWLKKRKEGIGGSDAAKILGLSKWGSARDLYEDKTTDVQPAEPDNWFMLDFGNMIEPLVRKWYAKRTGYKVVNDTNMYRHPEYPWMLADVDFTAETPEGEVFGGEIKTTSPRNIDEDWAPGILGLGGKLPPYYEAQVRHYMAVLDIDRFIVLCVYGNSEANIIPVQVYRDEEKEKELIRAESDFWNNHIVPRIPPEEGITSETLKTIRKEVFADGKKEEDLILSNDTKPLLEAYMALTEEEKEAKKVVDSISKQKNALTAEILRECAGHTVARLDLGGGEYFFVKNNTVTRQDIDSKMLKLNFPDVAELVKKESSYETTSVKIKKEKPKKGATA